MNIPTLNEALEAPGSHEVVIEAWFRASGAVTEYNAFRMLVDPAELRKIKWEESIMRTGLELSVPFNRADISAWVDGAWKIVATWNLESGLTWL